MIYYLVTRKGDHTYRNNFILDDARLAGRFRVLTYDEAFGQQNWQGGAVIFSDVDRLASGEVLQATVLYRRLKRARGPIRLLNHPTRTCRRYAVLRRLHDAGINRHNVFRLDEGRGGWRYPVFLRSDLQHEGAYTPLLHDDAALDAEIWRLTSLGLLPQDLLIVEFCDTADRDGIYRKATAYVVGDRLFQRYLFFGDHWEVKQPRSGTVAEKRSERAMLDEEGAYNGGDHYLPVLREVVDRTGFEFGRIDFDFKDGRPEIWEINSNPDPAVMLFANAGERAARIAPRGWQQLREALAALDSDAAHNVRVEIEPPPSTAIWYDWFKEEVRQRTGKPTG
ncbi:MAG: hypothetical protein SGJ07_17970 [Rhodospirillaceae bacterium]|nr:hypothetical protein [Rhodospirillaceae bacterium]